MDLIRIPSISADPAHAADVRRNAEYFAAELEGSAWSTPRSPRPAAIPRLRRCSTRRAPDRPRLRPLRRPAGRSARPVASPPFEPVRDGILGRGAVDDKGQVFMHLEAVEALLATRARCRSTSSSSSRARRSRARPLRRCSRRTGTACGRCRVISDTGFFAGILRVCIGLRGLLRPDRRDGPPSTSIPGASAAPSKPGPALAPIIAALKDPDGRVRVPGFYDDVVGADRGRRAALAALPSTRRPTGPTRPARRSSARPATRPSSAAAPGRRSMSTASGAASRARAEDDHPAHAHAKITAGSWPTRIPSGSSRPPGPRRGVAPPGVTVDVQYLGGGQPSLHPDRPPGDAGRGAGPRGGLRRGAGLHPRGRLDPGLRQLRARPRLPVVLLGFARRTSTPTRRTSRWASATTSGHADHRRMWDELAIGVADSIPGPRGRC